MQRGAAQRVTTASAKVTDEAEWDIGPEARAAWGVISDLGSNTPGQSSLCVQYQTVDSITHNCSAV